MSIKLAQGGMVGTTAVKVKPETRLFIDGKFVESSDKKSFTIISPATLDSIAEVSEASVHDTNAAVAAAKVAQPLWAALDPVDRGGYMKKLAQLLRENHNELAYLEGIAMGKPVRIFQDNFIAAKQFDYYAEAGRSVQGRSSLNSPGFINLTFKQPFGVVAAIIPWNGPVIFTALKLAPALAAGNTVVLKSSEKSPLSVAWIARLIAIAGFPAGVINILSGHGHTSGAILSSHMDIRALSFTGSVRTGRIIQKAAASSNMKNVMLELGGKSPAIIFADCDLNDAVDATTRSILYNCGQVCVAITRIYVQESVVADFTAAYKQRLSTVKGGDPLNPQTLLGPLADEAQYNTVKEYLELGVSTSSMIVGGLDTEKEAGWYVKPTIFKDVPEHARITKEEIFGPFVIINTFKTEEEVLLKANDTEFGLYSSVWTRDLDRALRFAKRLESGTVSINCTSPTIFDDMPFGGFKSSGTGREGFVDSMDHFMEMKSVYIKTK